MSESVEYYVSTKQTNLTLISIQKVSIKANLLPFGTSSFITHCRVLHLLWCLIKNIYPMWCSLSVNITVNLMWRANFHDGNKNYWHAFKTAINLLFEESEGWEEEEEKRMENNYLSYSHFLYKFLCLNVVIS